MEAIFDGDFSGSDVGDHLRNEERIVFRTHFFAVDGVVASFFFEGVDTADTNAENNADAVLVD